MGPDYALRTLVEAIEGSATGSISLACDIGLLYASHAGLRDAIGAGGLRAFCQAHAELTWRDDRILLSETAELPTVAYPHRVSAIIASVEEAVSCVTGAKVYAFGSSVNGFGSPSSDIDIVLAASANQLKQCLNLYQGISQRDLPARALAALAEQFRAVGFRVLEKVLYARVPILKLRLGNQDCDISINNLLPVFNTRLLKSYAEVDPRVVELTHNLKLWARQQGVHGASKGHLSSYAYTLLVIFYMQARRALPCLQQGASESPTWYGERGTKYNVTMAKGAPLGEPLDDESISLSDFARFYADEFQWGDWVVSIRTGTCRSVDAYPGLKRNDRTTAEEAAGMLHIEDPIETTRNLNCVLAPGSDEELRRKIRLLARIAEARSAALATAAEAGSTLGLKAARTASTVAAVSISCLSSDALDRLLGGRGALRRCNGLWVLCESPGSVEAALWHTDYAGRSRFVTKSPPDSKLATGHAGGVWVLCKTEGVSHAWGLWHTKEGADRYVTEYPSSSTLIPGRNGDLWVFCVTQGIEEGMWGLWHTEYGGEHKLVTGYPSTSKLVADSCGGVWVLCDTKGVPGRQNGNWGLWHSDRDGNHELVTSYPRTSKMVPDSTGGLWVLCDTQRANGPPRGSLWRTEKLGNSWEMTEYPSNSKLASDGLGGLWVLCNTEGSQHGKWGLWLTDGFEQTHQMMAEYPSSSRIFSDGAGGAWVFCNTGDVVEKWGLWRTDAWGNHTFVAEYPRSSMILEDQGEYAQW